MITPFNACDYLLDRHIREGRGDRLALTGVAGDVSYAELAERVTRAAGALRGLGLHAEQRVVMVMADSPEFVVVYLAAMRIGAVPVPVPTMLRAGIAIAASDGCPEAAGAEATGLLQAAGLTVYVIDDTPGLVVTRTVAMLVNGAVDARHRGVASAADIDIAMQLGTNYPLGPLAWGQSWGPATILAVLDAMHAWYGEDRYRPSALLRRIAAAGGDLREKP